eukprot:6179148-Pleurochrysis_carterae.AAC.2
MTDNPGFVRPAYGDAEECCRCGQQGSRDWRQPLVAGSMLAAERIDICNHVSLASCRREPVVPVDCMRHA